MHQKERTRGGAEKGGIALKKREEAGGGEQTGASKAEKRDEISSLAWEEKKRGSTG